MGIMPTCNTWVGTCKMDHSPPWPRQMARGHQQEHIWGTCNALWPQVGLKNAPDASFCLVVQCQKQLSGHCPVDWTGQFSLNFQRGFFALSRGPVDNFNHWCEHGLPCAKDGGHMRVWLPLGHRPEASPWLPHRL